MLKAWITWIFKIPQVFVVRYRIDNKKILVISRAVRGEKTKTQKYLVEHLVDDNLQVTDEMLTQEEAHFPNLLD